jgi:tetratricopeptide (TPR) repeat protein
MLLLAGCGSTPPTLPTLEQYPQASSPAPAQPAPSEAASSGVVTQPLEEPRVAVEERGAAATQPAVGTVPAAAPPAASPSSSQGQQQARPPAATRSEANTAAGTAPPAAIGPLTLDSGAAAAVPAAGQQEFERAVALAQSGDLAAAERAFDSLGAQYPEYSGPLVNVAILRAKAGNLESAEQVLQSAIIRNPNSAQAFNQLGIVYRRLGRFKDADTAYQRAVELDPNYANAYLNLGVLCDLYLQQPQRALQAFVRYLELLGKPDTKVSGWVSELKVRAARSSARSEQ